MPADLILLSTTEKSGSVFIRTDQLDGETDWKLRKAVVMTQKVQPPNRLIDFDSEIVANPPNDQIYDFKGYIECCDMSLLRKKSLVGQPSPEKKEDLLKIESDGESGNQKEALSLENTMWANTVLASSGHVLGAIVYTGKETRASMNSKQADTKVGKLDIEINKLSKFLFVFMIVISFGIVAWSGFKGNWMINFFRFMLLICAIIPISLRVNLDMGKVYYCWGIYNDD